MDDFWGPFSFGMSWLALALLLVWLLARAPARKLALRSRPARATAWTLVVAALAVFASGLPFSLGFCRGGLDDPLACSGIPVEFAEATSALALLLTTAGLLLAPVLAAATLIFEVLKRRSRAGTT